jgi:predicted RNase H-like HicB family nuclease
MRQYFAVIIQDPDMDFSVTFPDLPGCVATAATFEKARAIAGEALASHLVDMERNGEPVPEASTLQAIVDGEDSHCGAAILVQEANDKVGGDRGCLPDGQDATKTNNPPRRTTATYATEP